VYTAAFPEGMQLPAVNEQIKIYTDGTMGMSEPPFISVMGWESVPGENAR